MQCGAGEGMGLQCRPWTDLLEGLTPANRELLWHILLPGFVNPSTLKGLDFVPVTDLQHLEKKSNPFSKTHLPALIYIRERSTL